MKLTRWFVSCPLTLVALSACFAAQLNAADASPHAAMKLWPAGAPGALTNLGPEHDTSDASSNLIAGRPLIRLGNVTSPTVTVYDPPASKATGAAIVVFPGGGYSILALDLEGTEVCDWLTQAGVTCVLVKYRVPQAPDVPRWQAPLQDAQRALGLVRQHAAEWKIDPNRVGVLGFSAGGHLSAALSTNYSERTYTAVDDADKLSCKPDFAVIIYPGYLALADKNYALAPELQIDSNTPPTFLLQAEDDPVHVENALVYFQALSNAKVPSELHVYAKGGHGYGLRPTALPVTAWPSLVEKWLHTIGVLR
jgi:acetyl esterase/lipase